MYVCTYVYTYTHLYKCICVVCAYTYVSNKAEQKAVCIYSYRDE